MFSSALVSLFVSRIMQKLFDRFFTKFSGKGSTWAKELPLDLAGNPDHVQGSG